MISIIVTHKYSVDYLTECLDSIAKQEFKDYETVLVIDHSEDDLTSLISEYKDQINLRVFELEDGKTGVSAARNLGIKEANGEYIYFLDNDDYLYGESIGLLASKLQEDTEIVYGRRIGTWYKPINFDDKRDFDKEEEGLEERDFSNIYEHFLTRFKRLHRLSILGAIYKKSLFTDNNIWFDEELTYFADIPVVVSILDKVKHYDNNIEAIYVKRHHNDKQNNPALSQVKYLKTFPNYLLAYDKAKEAVKDNEEFSLRLDAILCKFVTLYLYKKVRWSPDDEWRNEYFLELSTRIQKMNLKKVFKLNFKRRGKRLVKAVRDGDLDKAIKAALRIAIMKNFRRLFKKSKTRNKVITQQIFGRMKMKEDWVVIESFLGRNCSGQPKYIYQYMQEHYGDKYKYIWVVDKRGIKIPGKHKTVKRMSLRHFYYVNRSKYWINNMRQPLVMPIRPETVMLATWHGTPLKRLVFDMDDILGGHKKYKNTVFKQTRKWDYLLSDNPFSTDKFNSCFMFQRHKILEYGYPANDPLYAPDREEHAKAIKKKLGIPEDKKVILYAPTWRDDQFSEIGSFTFELDLDVNRLEKEFGDEYVLLLRLHYWVVEQLDFSKFGSFAIDGSSYDDITDLYIVSDILMTDYSSVFFDYANLKRPMLFYTYDLERYRDVLHGFYLDMEKDLPGPMLLTNDDVVDAIKNIDQIEAKYKDQYEEFYNRFCCCDDGHATERVCQLVFEGKYPDDPNFTPSRPYTEEEIYESEKEIADRARGVELSLDSEDD